LGVGLCIKRWGVGLGLSTGARYFVRTKKTKNKKIKNKKLGVGLCIKMWGVGLGLSTGARYFVRTKNK
jgi:hypothetical protein